MFDPMSMKETLDNRVHVLRDAIEVAARMVRSGSETAFIVEHLERAIARDDQVAGESASGIVLRESSVDFRDELEGKDIRNGQQLQLWMDDHWINVRYEVASFQRRQVVLVAENTSFVLDRSTMRFRWPPRI